MPQSDTREEMLKKIYEEIGGNYYGCSYCTFDLDNPVCMIGDVFDWMHKKRTELTKMKYKKEDDGHIFKFKDKKIMQIMCYWQKPRKPIEEQSDECIRYVWNLCKQATKE